jgi:hypothetical protein
MDMWNVESGGRKVNFRSVPDGFTAARKRLDHFDICPLCKEQTCDPSILMISNQAGVPNRIIHRACFDDLDPYEVWQTIFRDWQDAQVYRDWFPES